MTKAETTRQTLLDNARRLFWTRGYANVSLREIAGAAGVDVALVARYFGSKRGLFDATLDDLPVLDPAEIKTPDTLIDMVVEMFIAAPRTGALPSPTALIMTNAGDRDVGAAVRDRYLTHWHLPLEQILGDPGRAARFSAAMLGMSVAEKALHLPGIPAPDDPAYEAQLRRLLTGALAQ